MTLSDLASIATVISSVAVLGSLIYLALQVQQTGRNQRALIQQGRAARTADSLLRMAQPEIAGPFLKGSLGDETMSPLEVLQFRNVFRAMMISAEDSYLQYHQQLLGRREFESVMNVLRLLLGNVGLRAMWRDSESDYEEGFRTFVDGLLRKPVGRPSSPLLGDWKEMLAKARSEVSAEGNPR